MTPPAGRGRPWAYAGAVLGAAASIIANVAHSYVPPGGAFEGWAPPAGAVVSAVFWPVALLLAVEILARITWPEGARWVALRFGGLVPVAIVAAVVSYRHMSGLLAWYHEDTVTVVIGPLAVDGLMVMAAGALIGTSKITSGARFRPPETAPDQGIGTLAPEVPPEVPEVPDEVPHGLPESAVSLARLRQLYPHLTQQQAAEQAALSLTTVKRYWGVTHPDTPGVNGRVLG